MLEMKIIMFAIFAFFLLLIYPLSKRYFKIPQLILGMAFGSSIPMVFILEKGEIDFNCILLYILTIAWAIVYDTYYAMADKKDDKKIPQNQVPRDYYKKSFNVPNPEKFTSFEFIEGFRY